MRWLRKLFGGAAPGRENPAAPPPDPAEVRAAEIARLRQNLADYADYASLCDEHADQSVIIPKKGEQVVGILTGAALTETRRTKGSYQGGSQGVSIRVMKGVSYRVGQHKGTFVPGPEVPTVIDEGGTVVVSNIRAVYVGTKHTREFRWDKLLSITTESAGRDVMFLLPVENRQRVAGIAVRASQADAIAWLDERIKLGLAIHQERLDDFLAGIRDELAELESGSV